MLKVVLENAAALEDSKELEATVDADLAAFDKWFRARLGNTGQLAPSEKAILKTYLYWKTKGAEDGKESDSRDPV